MSYMKAFEQQRFGPLLTDQVSAAVQGPKTKKKLWSAMDEGRTAALEEGSEQIEDFVACWIKSSIGFLANETGGHLDSVIEAPAMAQLFHSLFQANALPIQMTAETGPPPEGWPLVDETVALVYQGIADG